MRSLNRGNIIEKINELWNQTYDRSLFYRMVFIVYRIQKGVLFRILNIIFDKIFGRNFDNVIEKINELWNQTYDRSLFYRMAHIISRIFIHFLNRLPGYSVMLLLLIPVNHLMVILNRNRKHNNSVLHISYMIHIPFYTTRLLRRYGLKADYLSVGGKNKIWDKSDYFFYAPEVRLICALQEFRFFWNVVAKYEVIHSHFGMSLTRNGWELNILKKLGRKILINYRGCEIRNRQKNMAMHPDVNICQDCDYNASICTDPERKRMLTFAAKYGDMFLVTTPDMLDFVPKAIHFPFFLPQIDYEQYKSDNNKVRLSGVMKIVHVTAHPGIEGTDEIRSVIERLKIKGYKIEFVFLHIVQHEQVLREMASADVTIGKMKMGYYANAQIESMFLGVPAITYIRPEFMTDEIRNSGLIVTHLADLEMTLEYYLKNPLELEKKRNIARSSILQLHNDEILSRKLIGLYDEVLKST